MKAGHKGSDTTYAYTARAKWQFIRWFNVAGTLSIIQNEIVFKPNMLSRGSTLFLARTQIRSLDNLTESYLRPEGWDSVRRNGPAGGRRLASLCFRNNEEVTVMVKDPDALLRALSPEPERLETD